MTETSNNEPVWTGNDVTEGMRTPQEEELDRLTRELQDRSDGLLRRAMQLSRSRELMGYFPPPPGPAVH